jgi:hypothetical protein
MPAGDTEAAIAIFLQHWHGSHDRTVVTIGARAAPIRLDAALGRLNCHFLANIAGPTGTDPPDKSEMIAARAHHLDADFKDFSIGPEELLAAARAGTTASMGLGSAGCCL